MHEMKLMRVNEGDNFTIMKSPRERLWMEMTNLKFAYRCLPLAIANQHGWEVITNKRICLVWTGGNDTDSIKVLEGPSDMVASHFGYGVATFMINYLIRTPKDVNLYVTGSPNSPRSGISPLTGIVETDWNPATFTMNWKFTQANHIVIFEPGESVCYFFPVSRSLVEDTTIKIMALEEEPEEKKLYEAWTEKRSKTLEDHGDWEKDYFKGRYTDGTKCPVTHQTKLKLKDPIVTK